MSWGSNSVLLGLPTHDIRIGGLSTGQAADLQRLYSDFQARHHRSRPELDCLCAQVESPLEKTDASFEVDGFYSPRVDFDGGTLQIAGFGFRSTIEFSDETDHAVLNTERESDVARIGVVENFLRIYSAVSILFQGGLVLHSAGIVVDGRAWIFVGRSGSGKTTLTRKAHQAGAGVLSDDLNVILNGEGTVTACRVPFTGEFGRTVQACTDDTYPVAGIIVLEQGGRLELAPMTTGKAVSRLAIASPFVNQQPDLVDRLLENIGSVVAQHRVWRMGSAKDTAFDDIIERIHATV